MGFVKSLFSFKKGNMLDKIDEEMNTNRQNSGHGNTSSHRNKKEKKRGRRAADPNYGSDSYDFENSEDFDEVDSEKRFEMIEKRLKLKE